MVENVCMFYLWWLHVENFGDPPLKYCKTSHHTQYRRGLTPATTHTHRCRHQTDLHDEEMWVVDVEADRAEQVLHPGVVGIDSIDEVLVPATNYHLKERKDHV